MGGQKLRTHKGTKKRVQRTGGGKLVRRQAGKRHLLTGKRGSRKRRLDGTAPVDSAMALSVKRLMPYHA